MTIKQINYALLRGKLKLKFMDYIHHFGIVVLMFSVSIFSLFLYFKDSLNNNSKTFNKDIFLLIIISSTSGLIFFKIQHTRLNLKIVETNLERKEIDKIIHNVSISLHWFIITHNNRILEAKTFPSFFSGSWGEQITILFDDSRILINSICDLDQPSSIISMGRNKKNINTIIEEIIKANEESKFCKVVE